MCALLIRELISEKELRKAAQTQEDMQGITCYVEIYRIRHGRSTYLCKI